MKTALRVKIHYTLEVHGTTTILFTHCPVRYTSVSYMEAFMILFNHNNYQYHARIQVGHACFNVKLTEHKHLCIQFHVTSLENVDSNGCMFIELGMNQKWSCFLQCLYSHSMLFKYSAAPGYITWKTNMFREECMMTSFLPSCTQLNEMHIDTPRLL